MSLLKQRSGQSISDSLAVPSMGAQTEQRLVVWARQVDRQPQHILARGGEMDGIAVRPGAGTSQQPPRLVTGIGVILAGIGGISRRSGAEFASATAAGAAPRAAGEPIAIAHRATGILVEQVYKPIPVVRRLGLFCREFFIG
jgi:hypothetical protein